MIFHRCVFQFLTVAIAATAAAADITVVDLSQPLTKEDAAIATSPGAAAVTTAASSDPLIRSAVVLEDGKVVAEYYRDDVNGSEPNQAWSVTKSVTSLLVGIMIDDGKLSLNDTLGDIFPDPAWVNVTDDTLDFRKNVTIEEFITHSSGLVTPPEVSVAAMKDVMPNMTEDQIKGMLDATLYTGGVYGGGSSVGEALAALAVGTKGNFQIVGTSQILAYAIKELTGMTPRAYLQEKVFTDLGISESDYGWLKTLDDVEFGFHGIELTALQMAKFGQLYLQGGESKPGNQIVSKNWIDKSTSKQVANNDQEIFFPPDFGYGYLFWIHPGGNTYCAFGMLGQDVCVDKTTHRVMVQQRDWDPENRDVSKQMNLGVSYVVGAVASDPDLSFTAIDAPADGPAEDVPAGDAPADGPAEDVPAGDAPADGPAKDTPADTPVDAPAEDSSSVSSAPHYVAPLLILISLTTFAL